MRAIRHDPYVYAERVAGVPRAEWPECIPDWAKEYEMPGDGQLVWVVKLPTIGIATYYSDESFFADYKLVDG